MRLIIVRHGDPDYVHDCLTETGKKEAQLLVPRMMKEKVTQFYVSPLGRAQDTARPTLEALGRTAITLDWLQEVPTRVDINDSAALQAAYPGSPRDENGRFIGRIVWDLAPAAMAGRSEYYDRDGWRRCETAKRSTMAADYDYITGKLDELLAEYGYFRDGDIYRTEQGNTDTIVFFCHYGLTGVILSHFWNVNPYIIWNGFITLPTAVTELYTEEREKGKVIFRADRIGDISHLYAANTQPSFSGRFCETYERTFEQH